MILVQMTLPFLMVLVGILGIKFVRSRSSWFDFFEWAVSIAAMLILFRESYCYHDMTTATVIILFYILTHLIARHYNGLMDF
jgi:hypothetical protein